jgi:hypothetical protein
MMRKNLRKSSIALAVAAAGVGVVGLSTQAVAVQIGTDGLGEALIYPYYTTNNGYRTLIDVINTSDKTVAFKVRMRDAKNSRDCRDFNVVLSPHDVWVASIEEGADGFPRIWTPDNSCTSPALTQTDRNGRFVNFTNADYSGARSDSSDSSIDRCREGYVEIIEMGVAPAGGTYANDALHDLTTGAPPCLLIPNDFNNGGTISGPVKAEFTEPENVLKGNFSLIRTQTGQGFSGVPATLANFYSPLLTDGLSGNDLLSTAGGLAPSLGDSLPKESFIPDVKTGAGILFDTWTNANSGADPVSAVLMRSSVINEWSTNPGFGSNTDWTVTFPTKRFYVDPILAAVAAAPFTSLFNQAADAKSCTEITIQSWNREEKAETVTNGFSPFVPGQANELCFEANVVTFNRQNGEGVLESNYAQNIDTSNLGLFGWTRLDMTASAAAKVGLTSTNPGTTYQGLPVTGFAVINRSTNAQSTNYGGLFDHAYERLTSGGA